MLLAALTAGACTLSPLPEPPASSASSVTCSSAALARGMTRFSPADVSVYLETNGDPGLEITRADLASYLGRLWGGPVTVSAQAPECRRGPPFGSRRGRAWAPRRG